MTRLNTHAAKLYVEKGHVCALPGIYVYVLKLYISIATVVMKKNPNTIYRKKSNTSKCQYT